MGTIPESRLIGARPIDAPGRVSRLAGGSEGRPDDRRDEPGDREGPTSRPMKGPAGRADLDIRGTSGVAAMTPRDRRWPGSGAR